MRNTTLRTALIGALALLFGCSVFGLDEDTVTLYVGPQRVACVGVGERTCLLVKERPEEPWEYFYDAISGFEFEPGYNYKLLVGKRRIKRVEADGSSVAWRLIRVLEKAPSQDVNTSG